MNIPRIFFSYLILIIACLSTSLPADVIYISPNNPAPNNTISGGILYSYPGDTILVGPGDYIEDGQILTESVHLISEMGPEVTKIIHYGYPGEITGSVLAIAADDISVIGFTITNGNHNYDFFYDGGGIGIDGSNIRIENNIITGNKAFPGAAIHVRFSHTIIIRYNLIHSNDASEGGAIYIEDADPIIEYNTIAFNTATSKGAGIYVYGNASAPTIRHNIFYNNTRTSGLDDVIYYNSNTDNLIFECNNVWNEAAEGGYYYGNLTDQTGINGNISTNPLFCGIPESGNYYLQSGSPCVPGNVPSCCGGLGMGCYPVRCIVSNESSSWGKIKGLRNN